MIHDLIYITRCKECQEKGTVYKQKTILVNKSKSSEVLCHKERTDQTDN